MGMQSVIRFLLPREDHFYDFLERQAVVVHKGAHALRSFKDGDVTRVRDAVQLLEHEGDKIVHEMEEALAKTFVTPIDREDLQKLSSELDDVLDLMNGTVRAAALYGVGRATEPMMGLIDVLVRCTEMLEETMPDLRKHRSQGSRRIGAHHPQARERGRRHLPWRGERPLSRQRNRRQTTPSRKGECSRDSRTRSRQHHPTARRPHADQPRGEAWLGLLVAVIGLSDRVRLHQRLPRRRRMPSRRSCRRGVPCPDPHGGDRWRRCSTSSAR